MTIIASTIYPGDEETVPYRIVLRDNGREYVHHMETLEKGTMNHHGYDNGSYFSYDRLDEAIVSFIQRVHSYGLRVCAFSSHTAKSSK